jgi:hypothetical protein
MPTPLTSIVFGFGIPGIKPLMIVAAVAFVLYGRSGRHLLGMTRFGRMLRPFLDFIPARPAARPAGTEPAVSNPQSRNYVFWALVILAATALIASIATRYAVHSASGIAH